MNHDMNDVTQLWLVNDNVPYGNIGLILMQTPFRKIERGLGMRLTETSVHMIQIPV